MSTTDRVICYNKPCPCGEGTITITECSPDHPYARDSQTWYKSKINCETCKTKYTIEQIDEDFKRYIILNPGDENQEFIRLISVDPFCSGLQK